jgi:hypothetical protein
VHLLQRWNLYLIVLNHHVFSYGKEESTSRQLQPGVSETPPPKDITPLAAPEGVPGGPELLGPTASTSRNSLGSAQEDLEPRGATSGQAPQSSGAGTVAKESKVGSRLGQVSKEMSKTVSNRFL